jgi:hypothetical protein
MEPSMKTTNLFALFTLVFLAPSSFAAEVLFTPDLTARGEYTDNLFLTNEDEEDDVITVVGAGFDLDVLGKVSGMELKFLPAYAFYKDNSDLDTWRLLGELLAYSGLTQRTRIELRNQIQRTEDPLPVPPVPDIRAPTPLIPTDTTRRADREPYLDNVANLNLSHQFGREDLFNIGYTYGLLNNDDPNLDDNQRHIPNVDLTYWFSPFWSFFTGGRYTRALYDGDSSDFHDVQGTLRLLRRFTRHFDGFIQYDQTWRDFDDPGVVEIDEEIVTQRDFQVFSPSVGFNWAVTQDVPLSVRVGYLYRQLDSGSNDDGPVFDVNLGSTWEFKRGSIYFTGASGYRTADFGAQTLGFELYAETLVAANYFFTRHIRGDVFAGARRSDFKDTADDRKDNAFRTGAGLTFQIMPWMFLKFDYMFRLLDSTEARLNNYNENRGLVTLTFRPDRPWRF